jgi:Na+-transporting NADH:ubiquinone oxidoreductase subunit C
MKEYLKMVVFVLVMGIITSGVLIGMDQLTADRITANASAEIKTTIMDSYGIEYTTVTLHDVFAESVDVVENGEFTFYIDKTSGAVSYEFVGGGVWGPISGIITLESDFKTIRQIKVLDQQETPGLGGRIAEPDILARFVGIVLNLNADQGSYGSPRFLEINKNTSDNAEYEIDAIAGATRTSERFEVIFNTTYEAAKAAWDAR